MKKLNSRNYEITDNSSFSGLILTTTLENIIKKLGSPSYVGSGDNKVNLEWVYYLNKNKVFTIYDYKNNSNKVCEIKEWHIGNKGLSIEEIKNELIKKGFDSSKDLVEI